MANKKAKYCKPSLSDTCLHKTPLTCTEYDGILPTGSNYEEDDCLTGQDIIEDIIEILDDHTEQLDVSDFGCCLNYEASDSEKGLVIKDILSKHESILCDLIESCGSQCEEATTECTSCEELQPSDKGLVFNTTGVGNIDLDGDYTNFTEIVSYLLTYKTKVKGTYKITLDLDYTGDMLSSEVFYVGISLDGQTPNTGAFNQDTIKVANNTKTLHFVLDIDKNVNVITKFKKATTEVVQIEKVKIIIEKV